MSRSDNVWKLPTVVQALEEISQEAGLVGDITPGRECLRLGVGEGVLAEPIGPAMCAEVGVAEEGWRAWHPGLALRLERLLAPVDLIFRAFEMFPRLDGDHEAFEDRAIGFMGA